MIGFNHLLDTPTYPVLPEVLLSKDFWFHEGGESDSSSW